MAKEWKTKTELKQKAQDEIMCAISKAWYQLEGMDLTEDEKTELSNAMKNQADRVAKMFGYDEAWQV